MGEQRLMTHCNECEYKKFCLATIFLQEVTGCEISEFVRGEIPYHAVRIEKTVGGVSENKIPKKKRGKR